MEVAGNQEGCSVDGVREGRGELRDRWMAAMAALQERDPAEFDRVLTELEQLVRSRIR